VAGLSYSNYTLLRQCGEKYRLKVIEKREEPKQVHFEFGSALHAGLNTALETKDKDAAMDVFQAYWDSVFSHLDFTGERFGYDILRDMGSVFTANFTKRYASKMKLLVGEKRMYATYKFERTDLEGTPDALVEWNGANVLLDFKSSAYNYADEKSDVSLQLNLYAWLLEMNGYTVDTLCYIVFNKGMGSIQTPQLVPYDRKVAESMIGDMVTWFKRNEGHHEKNPTACSIGKKPCAFFKECWK
jgi:CRISPR/Cas system-associated exonuclease Cas4 (RecB family)